MNCSAADLIYIAQRVLKVFVFGVLGKKDLEKLRQSRHADVLAWRQVGAFADDLAQEPLDLNAGFEQGDYDNVGSSSVNHAVRMRPTCFVTASFPLPAPSPFAPCGALLTTPV